MDYRIFVVVLAYCVGIIGAIMGQQKGRPVLGFFLGAFLNIVGLAIIAMMKPKNIEDKE